MEIGIGSGSMIAREDSIRCGIANGYRSAAGRLGGGVCRRRTDGESPTHRSRAYGLYPKSSVHLADGSASASVLNAEPYGRNSPCVRVLPYGHVCSALKAEILTPT